MTAYHKELEKLLRTALERKAAGKPQTVLLHSCCAPCSSYVLDYLRDYLELTVFYYNPNITREKEYCLRREEQIRLIEAMNAKTGHSGEGQIRIVQGDYEPEAFFRIAKGLEQCPEGGERCMRCYEQRLSKTAEEAAAGGYDFYTTTLTISPLKNAEALNTIGQRLAEQYHTCWLPSDFKKRDGYKRSVALSEEYGLYRQDYCGCIYSQTESEKKRELGDVQV